METVAMRPAATRLGVTRLAAAGVAILVLGLDQVSKSVVMAVRPVGGAGGLVSVRLVHNNGASFGLGAGHPLVITLTAAVILMVAAVAGTLVRSRATALFLGAVVGGAAGNLADRLIRGPGLGDGAVVDWIHVAGYPATFNLADVAIRLGAVCALIAWFRASARQGEPRKRRRVFRARA